MASKGGYFIEDLTVGQTETFLKGEVSVVGALPLFQQGSPEGGQAQLT
jgi:hypothetical protein